LKSKTNISGLLLSSKSYFKEQLSKYFKILEMLCAIF